MSKPTSNLESKLQEELRARARQDAGDSKSNSEQSRFETSYEFRVQSIRQDLDKMLPAQSSVVFDPSVSQAERERDREVPTEYSADDGIDHGTYLKFLKKIETILDPKKDRLHFSVLAKLAESPVERGFRTTWEYITEKRIAHLREELDMLRLFQSTDLDISLFEPASNNANTPSWYAEHPTRQSGDMNNYIALMAQEIYKAVLKEEQEKYLGRFRSTEVHRLTFYQKFICKMIIPAAVFLVTRGGNEHFSNAYAYLRSFMSAHPEDMPVLCYWAGTEAEVDQFRIDASKLDPNDKSTHHNFRLYFDNAYQSMKKFRIRGKNGESQRYQDRSQYVDAWTNTFGSQEEVRAKLLICRPKAKLLKEVTFKELFEGAKPEDVAKWQDTVRQDFGRIAWKVYARFKKVLKAAPTINFMPTYGPMRYSPINLEKAHSFLHERYIKQEKQKQGDKAISSFSDAFELPVHASVQNVPEQQLPILFEIDDFWEHLIEKCNQADIAEIFLPDPHPVVQALLELHNKNNNVTAPSKPRSESSNAPFPLTAPKGNNNSNRNSMDNGDAKYAGEAHELLFSEQGFGARLRLTASALLGPEKTQHVEKPSENGSKTEAQASRTFLMNADNAEFQHQTAVVLNVPPGKPNRKTDHPARVTQQAMIAPLCTYTCFKMVEKMDPHYLEQRKDPRRRLISRKYAKPLRQLEKYRLMIQWLVTLKINPQDKNKLISEIRSFIKTQKESNPHGFLMIPNTHKICLTYQDMEDILNKFEASRQQNIYALIKEVKLTESIEIHINFIEALGYDFLTVIQKYRDHELEMNHIPGLLSRETSSVFNLDKYLAMPIKFREEELRHIAQHLIAEELGFTHSRWIPDFPETRGMPGSLGLKILGNILKKEESPIIIGGYFGNSCYTKPASKLKPITGYEALFETYDIYGWDEGTHKGIGEVNNDNLHMLTFFGVFCLDNNPDKTFVLALDPNDSSDPSQKRIAYLLSYRDLCDLATPNNLITASWIEKASKKEEVASPAETNNPFLLTGFSLIQATSHHGWIRKQDDWNWESNTKDWRPTLTERLSVM